MAALLRKWLDKDGDEWWEYPNGTFRLTGRSSTSAMSNLDRDVVEQQWGPLRPYEVDNPDCDAQLFHGPGHQSRTTCTVKGPHTIHHVVYGEFEQDATWKGGDAFTGVFDEPEGIHPAPARKTSLSTDAEPSDPDRTVATVLVLDLGASARSLFGDKVDVPEHDYRFVVDTPSDGQVVFPADATADSVVQHLRDEGWIE